MPFQRPPLADLIDRIRGDMHGRLEVAGPLLRRAMVDVLGAVWGGAVHLLYGYLDWAVRQLFGDTADDAELLRRASLYGIRPIAATFATGNVTVTGTDGSSVLAGEVLQLDANPSYTVTTGATIASGTGTVVVTAVLAGAAGNLPVGATLSFQSPVPGVNAATVTTGGPQGDGLAGGFDQETIASVRARYLLRLREPPQGGANQDYIEWALAAPGGGATRAWVFPNELGLGTVVVRFVNDKATPSIFPTGGQVAAVQAYFNAQRPVTDAPTAVAPIALTVAFTVHLVPDNGDTRAAVTAQLVDLFARLGQPGNGSGAGTIPLSQIRTAIGSAGVTDYTLPVPSADVAPGVGQLPVLGAITWT